MTRAAATLCGLLPALLAACATGSRPADEPPSTREFEILRGDSVIATETSSRSADSLIIDYRLLERDRIGVRASLDAEARVVSVDETRYLSATAAGPRRHLAVRFRPDSARFVVREGTESRETRLAVAEGTIYTIVDGPALIEQVLRRARRLGGDEVEVPVWTAHPSRIGAPGIWRVRFVTADSAVIRIGAVALHARTDRIGRFHGGASPDRGLVWRVATAR